MSLRLPRLTNSQYDMIAESCRNSGIPITQCPTCLGREELTEDGIYLFESGTYKLRGEVFDCDCETQMNLRIHYTLANIGDQYQRLDWSDFRGDEGVKDFIGEFLDKWQSFRINGMGVEFSSSNLGTGKTFAATYIGKELVKRGESVYFTSFLDAVDAITHNNQEITQRLRDTTVLIIDEIGTGMSQAQGALYTMQLEGIVRNRTDFNRVTLITTNLTPEELIEEYPRTYSLLEAKNRRIVLSGEDARQTFIRDENLELSLNEEVRPIT